MGSGGFWAGEKPASGVGEKGGDPGFRSEISLEIAILQLPHSPPIIIPTYYYLTFPTYYYYPHLLFIPHLSPLYYLTQSPLSQQIIII